MHRNYSELAAMLVVSLDLKRPPVAICFTDQVPIGVTSHLGRVPAGCKFWEDAAHTTFATSAVDHSLCAIGAYTHNLQPSSDLMDALKVFADLDYVRPQDLPCIPVLQQQPQSILYAPLAESPLPPDVVLLFVNAGQTLILSEATQQVENQNPPAMGRPACAVVPQVMNTGRAAMSLGCCGARAYLDSLTSDVAIFAIPGLKLEAYARRIEALSKANGILSTFHKIRKRDIAAGATPSVMDSLAALTP